MDSCGLTPVLLSCGQPSTVELRRELPMDSLRRRRRSTWVVWSATDASRVLDWSGAPRVSVRAVDSGASHLTVQAGVS